MHEFEDRLRTWRRDWLTRRGVQSWHADELEDQLRCAYTAALESGAEDDQAWCAAAQALGDLDLIHAEYTKERIMSPISKLTGIAITLGILGLCVLTGPKGLGPFVHIPSAIFVVTLVVGGLIASFGLARVRRAARASLASSAPLEPAEIDELLPVMRRGYRLCWMSGVVGMIIGSMQMLENLSDPSLIGRGLATATLTLLYGALLAELVFANGQQWIENRRTACS